MRTAEALVSTGPRQASLREVPVLEDGLGGLGEVLAAGVCGTDVALFGDSPLGDRIRPFVFGHENVVRVTRIDETAGRRWGMSEGDRVLVEEYVPCGVCPTCRAGRYRVCPRTDYLQPSYLRYGRMPADQPGPWGGFGRQLYLHPDTWLHAVPDGLPDRLATLAVPLANAHRWLTELAPVTPGRDVVVIGPGVIGLCSVAVAHQAGAGRVCVVGRPGDERRLSLAERLGADVTVVAGAGDDHEGLRAAVGTAVADVVVDATGGAPGALDVGAEVAAFGGTVVLSGAARQPTPTLLQAAAERELTLKGARGHHGAAIDAALSLLASGLHPFSDIVSEPVPLESAAETLAWLASSDAGRPIHISIVPKECR